MWVRWEQVSEWEAKVPVRCWRGGAAEGPPARLFVHLWHLEGLPLALWEQLPWLKIRP